MDAHLFKNTAVRRTTRHRGHLDRGLLGTEDRPGHLLDQTLGPFVCPRMGAPVLEV